LWLFGRRKKEDVAERIRKEVSKQAKRNLLEKLMSLIPGYKSWFFRAG